MEHTQHLVTRASRGLALLAAATTAFSGAASAAGGGARPMTVTSFAGIARSFDADAGRVAWIDSAWVLHVRSRRVGTARTLRYTSPYQEVPPLRGGTPLVLGVGRLAWLSTRGSSLDEDRDHVHTAAVGASRSTRVANASHGEGIDGAYVSGLVGDDSAFAYGIVDVVQAPSSGAEHLYKPSGGGVWSLTGTTPTRVPQAPPAIVLAESAGRIALSPVVTTPRQQGTPEAGPTVEIRDATTGAVDGSITPGGPVRAATMTPAYLDLLVGSRIRRYEATSGDLLGTAPVPIGVASDLDASGGWIAFHRARSVYALDVKTGHVTTIATAPWRPSWVAVDGRTLVWTESRRVAAGAVSKRTFQSRIRSLALPAP